MTLARRLGISLAALEGYMGAHGGVTDGTGPAATPAAAVVTPPDVLVTHALPAPRRPAWVVTDRPRYFMPG